MVIGGHSFNGRPILSTEFSSCRFAQVSQAPYSRWPVIDVIEKGNNYGWRIYEGNRSNINPMMRPITDFVAPVLDYGRATGTTVIGGYVYHGPGLPGYDGIYVYGDFGSGRVRALIYEANT